MLLWRLTSNQEAPAWEVDDPPPCCGGLLLTRIGRYRPGNYVAETVIDSSACVDIRIRLTSNSCKQDLETYRSAGVCE